MRSVEDGYKIASIVFIYLFYFSHFIFLVHGRTLKGMLISVVLRRLLRSVWDGGSLFVDKVQVFRLSDFFVYAF